MSAQQYALALIPKFTAAISMLFSSMVMSTIVTKIRRHRTKMYDRLILGFSIVDLFGSFGMFLTTWPIPKESGMLWAVGTQATCTFQGFLTQGPTIASIVYNASLTSYFVLVIMFQWREPKLRHYEWCFHIVPLGWGLSTGVAGILLKLYNNANLWCWIAEAEGERGENANVFRMVFFYGPLYLLIVVVTANVLVVTWYVRKLTKGIIASSPAGGSTDGLYEDESSLEEDDDDEPVLSNDVNLSGGTDATVSMSDNPSSRSAPKQTNRMTNRYIKMRQRVAAQNLRFALAFYWTWLPISLVRILQLAGHRPPFWLICLASIATPLQGLPNLLVYFWPSYMKYRKVHHERGNMNLVKWVKAGMQTTLPRRTQNKSVPIPPQHNPDTALNANPQVFLDLEASNTDSLQQIQHCLMPSMPSVPATQRNSQRQNPLPPPRKSLGKYKKKSLLSSITLSSGLETIHETKDAPLRPPARVASEFSSMAEDDRKIDVGEIPLITPPQLNSDKSSDSVPSLPRRALSYCSDSETIPEAEVALASPADSIPTLPPRPVSAYSDDDSSEGQPETKPPTTLPSHGCPTTLSRPPDCLFGLEEDGEGALPRSSESDDMAWIQPPPLLPRTSGGDCSRGSRDVTPGLPKRPVSNYEGEDEDEGQ